jgi:hypothetical protein
VGGLRQVPQVEESATRAGGVAERGRAMVRMWTCGHLTVSSLTWAAAAHLNAGTAGLAGIASTTQTRHTTAAMSSKSFPTRKLTHWLSATMKEQKA